MQKVIDIIKKNKIRVLSAFIWGIVMIASLAIFYFLKSKNDYYISGTTKRIIVGSVAVSTLLVLFRPKLPVWLSYILEISTILGVSAFIFSYLEPLVNDMETFNDNAKGINILIIAAILIFAYGVFQNAGYAVAIGGFAAYAIYLIDYYTIAFRGTPFILSDFFSARTAMGVMGNYKFVLDERMLVAFYITALVASFGAFVTVKKKKALQRIIPALCGIIIGAGIIVLLTFTEVITKGAYKTVAFVPINSAKENGLPLNIICSLKDSFIKAPEGYSTQKVKDIIEQEENSNIAPSATSEPSQKPNIIVIMNESFTDFDYLLKVELTEEPIPKFKAMKENCVKGTLISSIYGGNTPNSEFEFLTGCSLAFLPQGIVTFQQLIDHELPTFVTHLEDMGYSSTAIHLYNPDFFSRSRIYPLLGFDEFININNTTVPVDIIGDYATDESSFRAIEQVYEESNGNPFFTFCVTIQNHGGYWHWLTDVKVTNANSDYANDYASLIKKTDDAFADLIDYFSKVDEPTIIAMFGDHQPNLFDDFYDAIWAGYELSDEEKTYLKSKVPFVIWANYDIEEKEMGEMSINYLGPTILKVAGLPLSEYQSYLEVLHKDIPVISGIGIVDGDGNHLLSTSDTEYKDVLRDYEYLQYYYLKGNKRDAFFK